MEDFLSFVALFLLQTASIVREYKDRENPIPWYIYWLIEWLIS